MSRTTVDFGIDLGTTNSAVAVLRGVDAEVIKNNEDADTTPSAVWIDKRDKLRVGRAAKERAESDPDNTAAEFKLRMGTAQEKVRFAASGRELTPPQLSAEVLKSLRADVAQRLGEDIEAAVVTVPAAFDMSSCEATRVAAEAAGLRFAPLLQEPTAAALAYGFQSADENARWLVYDLGGGTFDAAVIQLRDGEFTVLNHRGDNHLGGKQIDWRIVEELLIPAVRVEFGLTDLARGAARWRPVVNKLKLHAEKAKIALSRGTSADIEIDLDDGTGRRFEFYYELRREDVQRLAEPFLTRSVNLCRKALEEARLGAGDIAKLILVGGPTLSPYLREHLTHPEHGLGIPLDFSQDPLTVVARGAAIFAGTQRIPGGAAPVAAPGGFTVQLEYSPVGPDTEPLIIGRIAAADGTVPAGLTVELVNSTSRPPWRGGKVAVAETGVFSTTLWAQAGVANTFEIELADASGTRRELTPNTLTYTVGAVETQPPLIHSLNVGLADNTTVRLIERGTPLPARARKRLRTAAPVHRGGGRTGLIRIPVLEGEHARGDRNRTIGRLDITADQVERSIPEGSEIEVTLEIDASRIMVARAYIPYLDAEFENVIDLHTETLPDAADLRRETEQELARLAAVRQRHRDIGNPTSELLLARIDDEQTATDTQQLVEAAAADPDAAVAAQQRLRDLRAAIDEAEDELLWPSLVVRAKELLAYVRRAVDEVRDEIYRRQFDNLEVAVRDAIESRAPDLLRQRTAELSLLWRQILDHTGELPILIFESLARDRNQMIDLRQADDLIEQGNTAVRAGEVTRLRMINARLRQLFAEPPAEPDPFSTIRGA
ncbi:MULTISPECIES: Hsp70 family protein [unclassified Nocardia]|uniref:Hsp70 family protein n=1 Tax=unclassified Nocardia TaxID=2637762 RepID=UPI001CE3D86C|nr:MULTISPECIES: Hsp70 family protein [unclassified Nocardia]